MALSGFGNSPRWRAPIPLVPIPEPHLSIGDIVFPEVTQGEVQIGYQEKFLHEKGCQALEQDAQGTSQVSILGECLGTWFTGEPGNVRLMVGLDGLQGLFQPKLFYTSVIFRAVNGTSTGKQICVCNASPNSILYT